MALNLQEARFFFSFLIKKIIKSSHQKFFLENEKRQSTEANTEMTQMLELSDKDFKATVI